MHCLRHPARSEGFTFLEIVAALAVLAVGILAVITLFPVGLENSKRAAERTRASLLVYSDLQKCRSRGFEEVTTRLSSFMPNGPFEQDPYFERTVQVQNPYTGATSGTSVAEVTVTASWPPATKTRTLTMSTLVADR